MQSGSDTLRRFAPGWKLEELGNLTEQQMRESLVQHWFSLLQSLKFGPAARMHPVRNSKRSTMYWLVFVSRHRIANRFWTEATRYLDQQQLPF
jgi:hypothetical protein